MQNIGEGNLVYTIQISQAKSVSSSRIVVSIKVAVSDVDHVDYSRFCISFRKITKKVLLNRTQERKLRLRS